MKLKNTTLPCALKPVERRSCVFMWFGVTMSLPVLDLLKEIEHALVKGDSEAVTRHVEWLAGQLTQANAARASRFANKLARFNKIPAALVIYRAIIQMKPTIYTRSAVLQAESGILIYGPQLDATAEAATARAPAYLALMQSTDAGKRRCAAELAMADVRLLGRTMAVAVCEGIQACQLADAVIRIAAAAWLVGKTNAPLKSIALDDAAPERPAGNTPRSLAAMQQQDRQYHYLLGGELNLALA